MLQQLEQDCMNKCNPYEKAQVYNYLGYINFLLDDPAASKQAYDLLLQMSPQIPINFELQTIITSALLAKKLGKIEEISLYLERYQSITDNENVDVLYLRAAHLQHEGNNAGALEAIDKAISIKEKQSQTQLASRDYYQLKLEIVDNLGNVSDKDLLLKKISAWEEMDDGYLPLVKTAPRYPVHAANKRL